MSRIRVLVGQLFRFGAVGAVGLLVDVVIFNVLRATVLSPETFPAAVLVAKVLSTLAAIGVNWLGNRHWTFAASRRRRPAREGTEFLLVSLAGMLIPLGCLWVSHYLLGFTSLLADNIASNVVGLALGAAFRFALYRHWVFSPRRSHRHPVMPSAPKASAR